MFLIKHRIIPEKNLPFLPDLVICDLYLIRKFVPGVRFEDVEDIKRKTTALCTISKITKVSCVMEN